MRVEVRTPLELALSYSDGPKAHSGHQVCWHAPLPRVIPSVQSILVERGKTEPRSDQIYPDPTANLQGLENAKEC